MKRTNNTFIITLVLILGLFSTNSSFAQLNGFVLTPSGTTDNFMKFVPKGFTVSGTNYVTGYLTLSAYKNLTTNQYTDPGIPVQKLQLQGGNILLCRTNTASTTPDINPTSRNGAILFSDNVTTANNWTNGKWGIEYDDQYSAGGLNFFKPISSLTNTRLNFNLFIKNDGNVGIGMGDPSQKLDIDGNIRLRTNATIGTWSNNSLSFNTNSLPRMVILADGKVGVGIIAPIAKLHVEGNSFFKEQMVVGTNTTPTALNLYGELTISSLRSTGGLQLIVADREGRLGLLNNSQLPGDNLGNHTATSNILMGTFGLAYDETNVAALKITNTNDISIPQNLSVNNSITVKGGIYGTVPGVGDDWNKLQISGSTLPDAAKIEVCDGSGNDWRSIKFITKGSTADYQFLIDSKMSMRIRSNKVEIGSDAIPTALNVYGIINAREVKVSLGTWSDYVFEPGYKLRHLSDVEDFILNNGHLPDIPSASTVLENGVNLGEMDALLLRKIEELTLYVIELQKNNDKMKGEIESLKTNLLTTQN